MQLLAASMRHEALPFLVAVLLSFVIPFRFTPALKGLRITAQGQPSLSEATLG